MPTQTYLILENIRSAQNVGSILRSADATAVSRVFLCGYTPGPDHKGVIKSSLGAENSIPIERKFSALSLIKKLSGIGFSIYALEQSNKSLNIFKTRIKSKKIALVLGNELKGVSKNILNIADVIFEIPMRGAKESLNVAVAAGIALYQLTQ